MVPSQNGWDERKVKVASHLCFHGTESEWVDERKVKDSNTFGFTLCGKKHSVRSGLD